jgi:hypothetical protein
MENHYRHIYLGRYFELPDCVGKNQRVLGEKLPRTHFSFLFFSFLFSSLLFSSLLFSSLLFLSSLLYYACAYQKLIHNINISFNDISYYPNEIYCKRRLSYSTAHGYQAQSTPHQAGSGRGRCCPLHLYTMRLEIIVGITIFSGA